MILMITKPNSIETQNAQRLMILEMIEASMALCQRLGPHELVKGCNCTVCVNKRKRIIDGGENIWKYRL